VIDLQPDELPPPGLVVCPLANSRRKLFLRYSAPPVLTAGGEPGDLTTFNL